MACVVSQNVQVFKGEIHKRPPLMPHPDDFSTPAHSAGRFSHRCHHTFSHPHSHAPSRMHTHTQAHIRRGHISHTLRLPCFLFTFYYLLLSSTCFYRFYFPPLFEYSSVPDLNNARKQGERAQRRDERQAPKLSRCTRDVTSLPQRLAVG